MQGKTRGWTVGALQEQFRFKLEAASTDVA